MKEKIIIRSTVKDISNFTKIPAYRKGVIEEAPDKFEGRNYAVNLTASFLHPSVQNLVVKRVIPIAKDINQYVLEPDVSKGTANLAYFRPGQYIALTMQIGHAVVTRPYTLCSTPKESVNDEYLITVRKKPDGFSSKHIIDTWTKGTQVEASAPAGNFFYQPIRDMQHILGICDNEGAATFLAMAKAIANGEIDCSLTLIYGCRKRFEALFADELKEIAATCNKFCVIFVASDETVDKWERGFITKAIIEKYAPQNRYSIFINGSINLFNQVTPHIAALKIERKFIRIGTGYRIADPTKLSDFPQEAIGKIFLCKVIKDGEMIATVPCRAEETLMEALEREGVNAPALCKSGECGFCRAKLTKGNVFIPNGVDARRAADAKYGIIHPCCSYPMSNTTLVIN